MKDLFAELGKRLPSGINSPGELDLAFSCLASLLPEGPLMLSDPAVSIICDAFEKLGKAKELDMAAVTQLATNICILWDLSLKAKAQRGQR